MYSISLVDCDPSWTLLAVKCLLGDVFQSQDTLIEQLATFCDYAVYSISK